MGRIKYLDGLRGIAALIVVLAHIAQAFMPHVFSHDTALSHGLGEAWLALPPLNLLSHGQAAVTIFFVLSGFVLSQPFLGGPNRPRAIADAVRRYPRLVIPVVASVLICWALSAAGLYRYGDAVSLTGALMRDYYAAPVGLAEAVRFGAIGSFAATSFEINPVLWTMHIELVGSMIVFALGLIGLGPVSILAAGAAAAVLLGEVFYLAFAAGSLLAWICARTQLLSLAPLACATLLGLGLMLLSYPYYGFDAPPWRWLARLPVGDPGKACRIAGAALVVAGIIASVRAQQLLLLPGFQFLGRISFSLYLVHFPVICSLGAGVFLAAHGVIGFAGSVLAATCASVAVSVGLALVMTVAIDEPALRVSRQIGKAVQTASLWATALGRRYRDGLAPFSAPGKLLPAIGDGRKNAATAPAPGDKPATLRHYGNRVERL